jgi:peptidoglycan hydrolase-like protein with peptidoglycan-binding domain
MKNTTVQNRISHRFSIGVAALALALLFTTMPVVSYAESLTRQLQLGMSGSDVSLLQSFLAKNRTIYPQGLVTGYFGTLTVSAVSNFQARNGIATAGRVGPVTLAAINAQMGSVYVPTTSSSAMITDVNVNRGQNTVNVSWNTNEYARGVVYYSTNPLVTYERANSVDVSGNTAMTDTSMRTSQNVTLSGLNANTTYYYLIYATDQDGNVSVTWPTAFQTTN